MPLIYLVKFQFTHPGRGATIARYPYPLSLGGFNSRTPGGVRRQARFLACRRLRVSIHAPREGRGATQPGFIAHVLAVVSIHAPREGCDVVSFLPNLGTGTFQFTHPGRGATLHYELVSLVVSVSIHAPREGCDRAQPLNTAAFVSFNSRTPGGVRRHPSGQ